MTNQEVLVKFGDVYPQLLLGVRDLLGVLWDSADQVDFVLPKPDIEDRRSEACHVVIGSHRWKLYLDGMDYGLHFGTAKSIAKMRKYLRDGGRIHVALHFRGNTIPAWYMEHCGGRVAVPSLPGSYVPGTDEPSWEATLAVNRLIAILQRDAALERRDEVGFRNWAKVLRDIENEMTLAAGGGKRG